LSILKEPLRCFGIDATTYGVYHYGFTVVRVEPLALG
jgi:hypothetical protein